MAEQFDLDTPEVTTRNSFRVVSIFLVYENNNNNLVEVTFHDNNGRRITGSYSGDNTSDAHEDIKALNKANLSSNSLQKRIMNQFEIRGVLPSGDVTGSPD